MANRVGYRLSRLRGRWANWCGPNYIICDSYCNTVKLYSESPGTYSTSLDDVEAFLMSRIIAAGSDALSVGPSKKEASL